ncbi:hypothetical protein BDW59DRAFT_161001 [Aspergillus cavernicola]|uniref:Fucose-specific lectin n=1 Tax=Aspergillus cavernicola TaxID=176166 RepID=A0ABR4II20_9EURO
MAHRHLPPENAILEIEDNDVVHYICQDGNVMTERDFDDGELLPPEDVGTAQRGTAAAYVVQGEGKRAIYCIKAQEEDILQDFEFDDEDGMWVYGQLSEFGIRVLPGTKLAAVQIEEHSTLVISQAVSGVIQAVRRDFREDGWQPVSGLPHTQPLPGSSIHALRVDDMVVALYAHQDCSIHELSLVNGEWRVNEVASSTERQIPGTEGEFPKSHISAAVADDGGYTLRFADETGAAYVMDNGEAILVGRITDDGFQKLHDAEGHGPKELKW